MFKENNMLKIEGARNGWKSKMKDAFFTGPFPAVRVLFT